MTPRASRLVKVAGVALGLLGGLAGGLYGYRAYASRSRRAAEAQATAARAGEAQAAGERAPGGQAAGVHPAAAQPDEAAAGRTTTTPAGAPALRGSPATPSEVAEAGAAVPGTAGAAVPGTAAEREARLMARLAASSPVPSTPSAGALDTHPSERRVARSPPPPGSPAAREAELLRRVAEGGLPAATRPLVVRPPLATIAPEARARADLLASGRQAAEARQARETAWPAIEEAEPPPGPRPHETPAEKPRPRAPRLELPSRLDQWGE